MQASPPFSLCQNAHPGLFLARLLFRAAFCRQATFLDRVITPMRVSSAHRSPFPLDLFRRLPRTYNCPLVFVPY